MLRIETDRLLVLHVEHKGFGSISFQIKVEMLIGRNGIAGLEGCGGKCIQANTLFGALLQRLLVGFLSGDGDERHLRVGTLLKGHGIAPRVELINTGPLKGVLRLQESGSTLKDLIEIEGAEVQHRVDRHISLGAAHHPGHGVHVAQTRLQLDQ